MSRVATVSFGVRGMLAEGGGKYQGSGSSTGNIYEAATHASAGRFPGTRGLQLNRLPVGPCAAQFGDGVGTNKEYFHRFYMRVRRMPTTGSAAVFYMGTTPDFTILLRTDGKLQMDPVGGTTGNSTTVLALNTWYRVECQTKYDSIGGGDSSSVELRINGVTELGPYIAGGGNMSNGFGQISAYGFGPRSAGYSGADAEIDVTDYVVDDAVFPGASRLTILKPVAAGTYSQFNGAGDAPTWQNAAAQFSPYQMTGEEGNALAGANGQIQSYLLQSMAAAGITGNILSVRAAIHYNGWGGGFAAGAQDVLVRQNGVDTFYTVNSLMPGNINCHNHFFVDGSGWAITDTIEVGLRIVSATRSLNSLCLIVEHDTADPAAETDGDIAAVSGTFAGGGAVPVAVALGWQPDFVMVRRITAGGDGADAALYWNGTSSHAFNATHKARIMVDASGFTAVCAGDGTWNVAGQTYGYIAFKDKLQRCSQWKSYGAVSNVDDWNIPLDTAAFVPDWAFVFAAALQVRGTGHAGDSSSSLHSPSNAAANFIQSLAAGVIQVGTGLNTGNLHHHAVLALNSAGFTVRKLWNTVTWVGDGAASRAIPIDMSAFTPDLVLVVPSNNGERFLRHTGHAGLNSNTIQGTALSTTGIIGLGVDGFTVGSACNVNTVVYSALVFSAGADPAIAPEVEFVNGDTTIGLCWVERLDSNLVTNVSAKIALPDPATYYFGFKKDTIIKWGTIRRALSDRNGQYEGTDFSWVESDVDRSIRAALANESTKYFVNRPFTVRMIADPDRRLLRTPRTVVKGIIREYRPLSPLHFEFTGQDILAQKFSPQNDKDQIPQRTITLADFASADAAYILDPDTTSRKVDGVGKCVPIIYGSVNNIQNETLVTTTPGTGGNQALEFNGTIADGDATTPGMNGYGATPGTFLKGERIHATVTVIKGGKESLHSHYFGNTNEGYPDGSGTHGSFGISWNRVDDADGYRVYAFPSFVPGGFDPRFPRNDAPGQIRVIFHDNNPATFDGLYGAHYGVIFSGWNSWVDFFTGSSTPPTTTTSIIDRGTGQVGVTYVGRETIDGALCHAFLICGHAVKSIDQLYFERVSQDLATSRGNWKVPGYDGRPKFEDRNGNRYCMIYGLVGFSQPDACAIDPTKLGLAVQGIESVGDGSGTLITNLLQQYKHAVINWILQSYTSGAWLAAPVFPDDVTLSQIDEQSFTDAETVSGSRVAGGYVGAFIIGANQERLTIRDQVALFNVNADVDSGFNRKTQFMVSMVSEAITQITDAGTLTDALDIFSGSFDIEDRVYELFNKYEYHYKKNYLPTSGDKTYYFDGTIQDQLSIDSFGEEKNAPPQNLDMIRDATIALDIVQRKLMRTKTPPRMVKLKTGLAGVNYELGNILKVTHYQGIGAAGWVDRPVRIMRHETEPDDYSVSLECLDMQSMFGAGAEGGGAFILGDETAISASWATATNAQKVYGYLADETTGQFSNGKEGKHLR